jgi:hypothetical protein
MNPKGHAQIEEWYVGEDVPGEQGRSAQHAAASTSAMLGAELNRS